MLFELLDKHLSNEVLGLGPQGGIQSRIQYILTNSFRQLSSSPNPPSLGDEISFWILTNEEYPYY